MSASRRGWTSAGLKVIQPDDYSYWAVSDAVLLLGGGLKPEQIRSLIRLAGIIPAGKRHGLSRRGGRYVRVYSALDLIRAYEAVADVMGDGSEAGEAGGGDASPAEEAGTEGEGTEELPACEEGAGAAE